MRDSRTRNDAWTRNAARRLVAELVVVGVLAGSGATFPRGTGADQAWSFLFGHLVLLAHAVLGLVVVVEAARLTALMVGSRPRVMVAQGAGLAGAVGSVCAGVAYVGAGQHDAPLAIMTGGWVLSLVAGAVIWRWAAVDLAGRSSRVDPAD